jgi:protein SCO1/2
VITLAILIVILVTLLQRNPSGVPQGNGNTTTNAVGSQGTDLGGTPAPNFTLTDQNGQQVSLSQFKGQPIVLTFLYTHCPDLCPLTAEKLHTVMLNLGSNAQKVAVIAVSTDPKGDTAASALNFSKVHQMQDSWHYLIGTQNALSPVWSAYNVYAQSETQSVNHTLSVYVIDKQGRERIYFGSDFTPSQLTANLQQLLKE